MKSQFEGEAFQDEARIAPRKGEIPCLIQDTHAALDSLAGSLALLKKKLDPLIPRDIGEDASTSIPEPKIATPMGTELYVTLRHIRSFCATVDELNARIEL